MITQDNNRKQILLRMVSKSHQMLDDIHKLTMQIKTSRPDLYMHLDETPSRGGIQDAYTTAK
jgi:hypothetical protein